MHSLKIQSSLGYPILATMMINTSRRSAALTPSTPVKIIYVTLSTKAIFVRISQIHNVMYVPFDCISILVYTVLQ